MANGTKSQDGERLLTIGETAALLQTSTDFIGGFFSIGEIHVAVQRLAFQHACETRPALAACAVEAGENAPLMRLREYRFSPTDREAHAGARKFHGTCTPGVTATRCGYTAAQPLRLHLGTSDSLYVEQNAQMLLLQQRSARTPPGVHA